MAEWLYWNPTGEVALEVLASGSNVKRISATQFTVDITASWKTYYSGAETTYGMQASSGGKGVIITDYSNSGNKSGSTTFTGTYDISGNGSATKTITVTFTNYNASWSFAATKNFTFDVTVPAWTSYVVSYNANGGSGAPSNQTKWKDQDLTLSSTKPTRSGYTFVGWGSSATSTEPVNQPGGVYKGNAAYTYYAIWSKKITLTYNANSGSGAPSSQSATIYNATTNYKFTISSTVPTRTGYTFLGWSTSNSATSSSYSAGGSITLSSSTTLYAVWKIITYTVSYNANGGSGAPSSQTKTYGVSLTLSSTKPTRTGYTFKGWATSSGGSVAYSSGGSYTSNANATLYAVWSENALTVNYYSNYATESFSEALNAVGADKNVIVRTSPFYYDNDYSENGHWDYSFTDSSTYLGRTGYTATGYWGTSPSGGTLVKQSTGFASGQAMAEAVGKSLKNGNASVDLYAQWQINTYTIAYNANGGSGNMSSQSVNWNATFSISNNTFYREGYKFVGWNLYRNDDDKWHVSGKGWFTESEILENGYTKTLYQNQRELTFDSSWINGNESARLYTYYAVWEISGVVYIDNGGELEPYLAYIDNGSDWDLYLAYIDNGSDWDIIS